MFFESEFTTTIESTEYYRKRYENDYEAKKAAQEAEERAAKAEAAAMDRELAASVYTDYRRFENAKRGELEATKEDLMRLIGFASDVELNTYIKRIADIKCELDSLDTKFESIGKYI